MIKSKNHLSSLLKIPYKELEKIAESADRYHYTYYENKYDDDGNIKLNKDGNPKTREISPSLEPLLTIQKRIKKSIFSKIEFPKYIHGSLKKRDNVTNSIQHKGKNHHFVTDLKDFFPSITAKMTYRCFLSYGFSYDISYILTKLTTYKNEVPQGAPTSSYVANMILKETDEKIFEFCKTNYINYTRYVDDLFFSSQKDFKKISTEIIKIIQSSFFRLSYKKTKYKIGPITMAGVKVKNNVLDITDKFKKKMKNNKNYSEETKKGFINYYNKVRKKI